MGNKADGNEGEKAAFSLHNNRVALPLPTRCHLAVLVPRHRSILIPLNPLLLFDFFASLPQFLALLNARRDEEPDSSVTLWNLSLKQGFTAKVDGEAEKKAPLNFGCHQDTLPPRALPATAAL